MLQRIRTYVTNPAFVPEQIARASVAAKGLCAWVRAIDFYNRIQVAVAPRKRALEQAERELQTTAAVLQQKRQSLAELEEKIVGLEVLYLDISLLSYGHPDTILHTSISAQWPGTTNGRHRNET